jgi:hypothetical protein
MAGAGDASLLRRSSSFASSGWARPFIASPGAGFFVQSEAGTKYSFTTSCWGIDWSW